MASTLGSSQEKLVGLSIDSIPNKIFAEEVYKSLNGKPGYFEGEYRSYTGNKTSYLRAIWIPIKEKGEILASVGIVEDITERLQADESIRVSEAKFRTIFDSVDDAIVKGTFVIGNHDINDLVEEMLHILQVSISKKTVLRPNLTRPLPPIEADATQIRQVIMNLVINASEAIGNKSG